MPLIEYANDGQIFHVIHDPIPPGYSDVLADEGKVFIVLPAATEVDMAKQYVSNGELCSRPEFDAPDEIVLIADGVSAYTIALPNPCAARIDGESVTIEGGTLELCSDMPAVYHIELLQTPFIPKTIMVTCNAVAEESDAD